MKRTLIVTLFLLVAMAWAVAQQQETSAQSTARGSSSQAISQSTPSGSQGTSSTSPSGTSSGTPSSTPAGSDQSGAAPTTGQSNAPSTGQTTSPGAGQSTTPSTGAGSASGAGMSGTGDSKITEGCLGGANPNYTITDKAGTTYKLAIPPNADASSLQSHVGESVQVMGAVSNGGSTGSAASGTTASGAGASSGASIAVSKIGRGTGTCPGSTNTPKPPSQ